MPKYSITNIRRGNGHRTHIVYATVVDALTGELQVSATLEYCVAWVVRELPYPMGES